MSTDLAGLHLEHGAHPSRERGMCLMEAVAWVAGEEQSDAPACASPVLAAFGRSLNDALDDDRRQELVPLVPLLVGSVDRAADQADGLVCAHFLVAAAQDAAGDALQPTVDELRAATIALYRRLVEQRSAAPGAALAGGSS